MKKVIIGAATEEILLDSIIDKFRAGNLKGYLGGDVRR